MGSLTSELLNIHEGKFIVKASIQVGGSTLATGLSAAHSIEQAEDQARARALIVLGIDGQPYPTQAQIVTPEPDRFAARNPARLSAPATEFLPLPETHFHPSEDVDWAIAAHQEFADPSVRSFQVPEQQLSWLDREPEPAPHPATPAAKSTSLSQRGNPRRADEQARTNALSAPVDLSDILAHTDIELKRLGWTSAQGRRYLEQAYGKRSRQHLSDTELMEFLDYLKTQPTPGKSVR